jgi:hypothetical protein
MTLQTMSFIFGAILLAVAILGGGFEVKEIKVSNVSVGVRIVAGIVGLLFIVLGFGQQPPIALTESGSAPEAPRVVQRPAPKPDEALVVGKIPFISDRDRIDVDTLYVPAQDHKALAISYSKIGMTTDQADIETAKNGALDNCRKALEVARIHNKCELYAVGNTVVYKVGHPPMPNPPWFRTDSSIERPFNSKDIPLVAEGVRSVIEKNYPGRPQSKALALSPRSQLPAFFTYFGSPNQEEAARRALEGCGSSAGVPCMIIAVDDVFVVPIPTVMKAVGFFQLAGNALVAPGSRDDVARRLANGTTGWSAVAAGVNGLVGVVPNAGTEHDAIEGALADCSRHDRGCQVIAIGPFSVVAAEIGKTD